MMAGVEVSVRPAVSDEAEVLARLQRSVALAGYGHIFPPEASPPTLDALVDQWRRDLDPTERRRRAFVAVSSGEVIGVVLAGPDGRDDAIGHLSRLYVAAERWGDGVGAALYDRAMEHLTDVGYEAVTLWVLERNERARRWYERMGWILTGERSPVYPPAGIDDVGYRLELSPR
jgi:ribosomal protein S18 acetylase RimI-like enzyme